MLPNELLSSLGGIKGFDAAAFEKVHREGRQVTSIRFNPAKLSDVSVSRSPLLKKIPWSSMGYYLDERPSFTFDPLFHAGVYYVQEASSMFLEQALKQTVDLSRPLRILDLCAAPGGKSTLIQSLISADSLLVSNEVIRSRAGVLQENITKWGAANTIVTQNDPRDFGQLENYFDVIVVDAPCSGSGLFRRDAEAIKEWSVSGVQLCSERQQRILADCWPSLKEDGVLIYSTCSYSCGEDEDILDWMMGQLDPPAGGCRLQVEGAWNIVETTGKKGGHGYRFYPDRLDGEGFFIACVQKKKGGSFTRSRIRRSSPDKLSRQEREGIGAWVIPDPDASRYFFRHGDLIYLLPGELAEDLSLLRSALYLKKAGVELGQMGAREFIPEHALAMSPLAHKQIPTIALSKEEAIRYLRKDEIHPESSHRGWALVQYEGLSLGWIKILQNRINNYYPKDWRILKR